MNLSKDQIINKAIDLHMQGKVGEASTHYQFLINQNLANHIIYTNYGAILQSQGKLKEAEFCYRKAVEIDNNYANAYSNLGIILKNKKNIKEAEFCYRKAIEIDPNFANAYLNLGIILQEIGNQKEAELYTRRAIKLNPKLPDNYLTLGNIFKTIGNLKEAEINYRKGIDINPNYAIAYINLGTVLRDLGKLKEAELSYLKAITLNSNYAIGYSNLGNLLKDLGKTKDAFDSHLKALKLSPSNPIIYNSMAELLNDLDIKNLKKEDLKFTLNLLLKKNDVTHKELIRVFNFLYKDELIVNLEKLESDFSNIGLLSNDSVIINAFKNIIFNDPKLEQLLTKFRRNVCHSIAYKKKFINQSVFTFIVALGKQCFLNEYVYSINDDEKSSLNIIIRTCQDVKINEENIAILSCYYPLNKLLDSIPYLRFYKSPNINFKELIKMQILEPIEENQLSKCISSLGSINDKISQQVKSQYEENPYPRWRCGYTSGCKKISFIKSINSEIKPNIIKYSENIQNLKVLIAGCGTGQQILHIQSYKNARVTAIDLSLSSLSYAKRKINELGIDNVELIQMDILEISLLKTKFDIIICSGVLHHMNNPLLGLKKLIGVLNDNGFIKLGLYSNLARKDIISARKFISKNKLQFNNESIHDFREQIFSEKERELNSIKKSHDFYTLSSCRDLCFHTQEHRYTINQLNEILISNKLNFLGFLLTQPVKYLYQEYFPEDKKQTNLQNWAKFEEKHPNTFRAMYQFWVSKKEN